MTRRISLVAVCCSRVSVRSRLRASSSWNRRTFSMAITAWSAKVSRSSICLSEKGRTSRRRIRMAPRGCSSRNRGVARVVRWPKSFWVSRPIGELCFRLGREVMDMDRSPVNDGTPRYPAATDGAPRMYRYGSEGRGQPQDFALHAKICASVASHSPRGRPECARPREIDRPTRTPAAPSARPARLRPLRRQPVVAHEVQSSPSNERRAELASQSRPRSGRSCRTRAGHRSASRDHPRISPSPSAARGSRSGRGSGPPAP